MVNKRFCPGALFRMVMFVVAVLAGTGSALAQRASATPVPVVLARATPNSAQASEPEPTAPPTETDLPATRLQALASAGEVNVRALPDVDSELVGKIVSGTAYPVLRNYYRWYEFRFDLSPSGSAWVYGDLVELAGDLSQIEVIDDFTQIAAGSAGGADLVEDRTIELAAAPADSAQAGAVLASTPLPTFTPPSATQAPSGDPLRIATVGDSRAPQIPPIVPILALGGLGLLGLLISLLRA